MNKPTLIFLASILLLECSPAEKDLTLYKEQIIQTEKEFEAVAKSEGLAVAFGRYADETAVMDRGKLVRGKDSIRMFYENTPSSVHLSWTPDFVDVSASGDMAYTYGKYLYQATDSTGKAIESRGIFHTVWKRQTDGSWRFVWD